MTCFFFVGFIILCRDVTNLLFKIVEADASERNLGRIAAERIRLSVNKRHNRQAQGELFPKYRLSRHSPASSRSD